MEIRDSPEACQKSAGRDQHQSRTWRSRHSPHRCRYSQHLRSIEYVRYGLKERIDRCSYDKAKSLLPATSAIVPGFELLQVIKPGTNVTITTPLFAFYQQRDNDRCCMNSWNLLLNAEHHLERFAYDCIMHRQTND